MYETDTRISGYKKNFFMTVPTQNEQGHILRRPDRAHLYHRSHQGYRRKLI